MKISDDSAKLYGDTNLKIIFSVTLMAVLGVASITPAFPTIARELNISTQAVGMLITVFTLPGIVLTPFLGIMADRYGRKKTLVPSLMLFGVAGGACFFARDFTWLLVFRFIQGLGAASLGSLNVTIIGDLYAGRERAAAMGYNASVLSIGTASYPLIGGALATVGWYYPFVLPPIAVGVGLAVLFLLKNPEPKSPKALGNYFGNMMPFIIRPVIGLFLASVFTFIILYGAYLTYFPFLIKHSFNGSPLTIGLLMSAMSLTTAATSSQLGRLVKRFSEKSLLIAAFALYGASLALTPFVEDIWQLLIPIVVFGLGHGINIPSIQTLLAGFAPIEHRAAFMSINSMVLRLGQTLGPPVAGFFFAVGGLEAAFVASAAMAVVAIVIVWIFID